MRLRGSKALAGVLGPKGPLGVFHDYPLLLRFAIISVLAEIAWATLIIVLQYHFQEDLLTGQAQQLIASRIATVTLAFVGCEMLFKVPMGVLSDRLGPRPLILFALGLSALSPVLMLLATQWYHFLPMRMMDGLAAAALWPAMSSLMARSVPREAKAAAMGVFNGAYCLGLAVGPLGGLIVAHQFGNRAVFPLCALLLALGFFAAKMFLRDGVGDRALRPVDEDEHALNSRLLRGRPLLVRMMVLYAFSQAAVGMFANVAVPYIKGQFDISEGDLPRAMAVPALFVAFAALPLGRAADKIGRPQAVWISYVLAFLGMTMVAATSLFEPDFRQVSPSISLFAVGLLLLIASYILGTPAWLGLTSLQVDETRQAKALSLMQFAQGVGVVIGSALVASAGHLLSTWTVTKGRFQSQDAIPIHMWLWLAAGVFGLCLIGTLLYVREPEHSESAEEKAESAKQPLEITGV